MGVKIESYLHFVQNGTFVSVLTFCFQIYIKELKEKLMVVIFFFSKTNYLSSMAGTVTLLLGRKSVRNIKDIVCV